VSGERACDLCGSRAQERLWVKDGWPIVRCCTCGLVFVGRDVPRSELIALYDEAYYEDPDGRGYGGYTAAEGRKRLHNRTLLDEIERLTGRGDLLEIGCAYGYFLDEARARGWRVAGMEPSDHAAAEASGRLGVPIPTTPFTELPVERESLDAVAMWDVIEHLPDPRATLERAHACLRPDGVIAISTGNIGSMAARLQGAEWSLLTPPWHQFYFSKKTLRRMLRSVGFRVVRTRGDGLVAVDVAAAEPRVTGLVSKALRSRLAISAGRRLGAGGVMFVYGRKQR
jgi:SAM-dependent methyltransferase